MRKKYLIGVDLGTSSTRAALYQENGALITQASAEVSLHHPDPDAVEQDSDEFYSSAAWSVQQCLRSSGVDARQVAAIAFCSQMAGVTGVDDAYRPTMPYDSWLDMRCQPYIEAIEHECGDLVTRLTGCPPMCDHGPKILWWQHEHPDVYARTAKFLMPAAYVAGRLAGLDGDQAYIDYTFLHFSSLSDAEAGTWSDELCKRLGVAAEKLPRILSPWDSIGEVTSEGAADFGLVPGIPVAAGAGDTAAGALGAGVAFPGMLFDTAGTASVLALCSDRFVPDVENRVLLVMRSVLPGLWNSLAYMSGGLVLRWYRDTFAARECAEAQQMGTSAYAVLDRLAETVPAGSDGLLFLPHLGGRVCPTDSELRGVWAGISWNHTAGHFYRSVLESVAYEYAYFLSILRQLLPHLSLTEVHVIGGGARSDLWNRIKANVLRVPYVSIDRAEPATWGAAMIAGHAAGLYPDLAQVAAEQARPVSRISPEAEIMARYQAYLQEYTMLLAEIAPRLRRLSHLP